MTFRISQKVVCIRDDWKISETLREWVLQQPRIKEVYTIRAILKRDDGSIFLRFFELVNPVSPWDGEARWYGACFRPLIDRKTDISIFKKLLTPSEPERVRNTREVCGNE